MASLKLGSAGPTVAALQQQLQRQGFDPGPTDGQFGPSTDAAVRAFQQSVSLQVDGLAYLGPKQSQRTPNEIGMGYHHLAEGHSGEPLVAGGNRLLVVVGQTESLFFEESNAKFP